MSKSHWLVALTAASIGLAGTLVAQSPTPGGHVHYTTPQQQASPTGALAPRLQNLGSHTFPVSTRSAAAQRFINQGLNLAYAFNHAEARRAFREAARLDPNLAMAHWGQALVLGPNINAADGAQRGTARLRAPAEGDALRRRKTRRHASGRSSRRWRTLLGQSRGPAAARRGVCRRRCGRCIERFPERSRRRHALRRVGDGPAAVGLLAARRHARTKARPRLSRSPKR